MYMYMRQWKLGGLAMACYAVGCFARLRAAKRGLGRAYRTLYAELLAVRRNASPESLKRSFCVLRTQLLALKICH